MDEAVGEMYVAKYFPAKDKERMLTLVKNLQTALGQHIAALDWMSDATKAKAQEKLASMSGVSYGSVKRFESTGQISLLSLTKIAMALDIADELRNIFSQVPYRDIKEVINETR